VINNTTNLIRRYVGNWYRTDSRGKPRPENMIFTFVATMLPSLVFNNPGVERDRQAVRQPRGDRAGMEMAINGWVRT
jgi:hypothetical protein